MRKAAMGGLVLALTMGVLAGTQWHNATLHAGGKAQWLSHDVYFTLKEDSPKARHKLVQACKKYLSGHPGEVFFAAGTLAEELDRDVNDRDFDVALHIVFENKAAHDMYQTAKRHLQFIAEEKSNWSKVRVFDSVVQK